MKRARPYVIPCSTFGGRSPKTGKPVGERHRWTMNVCDFCHKHRDADFHDGREQRRGLHIVTTTEMRFEQTAVNGCSVWIAAATKEDTNG